MNRIFALTITTAVLAAVSVITGCSTADRTLRIVDRTACEAEPAQLTSPLEVRSAPATQAPTVATLSTGHFVYRCGSANGWVALMFPAKDEAVDCGTRGSVQPCATGWVEGEPMLELFG